MLVGNCRKKLMTESGEFMGQEAEKFSLCISRLQIAENF
jgi:hypothetical protein